MDADDGLATAIAAHHGDLTGPQIDRLVRYRDLILDSNQRVNVTAVRERGDAGRRLILESLRLVEPIRIGLGKDGAPRVLDIGTGGGVPGMVLAIALPEVPFTLLDATGKKVAAVRDMAQTLGLVNVSTLHARAEEAGHLPDYRGQYTVATARAVSSLAALLELGLPFLKLHGTMVLPKGMQLDDELRGAAVAARLVGGTIASVTVLPDNGSHIETTLVTVEKIRPTPASYPRRSGLPTRQPLGREA